jgi:hypothetical protein
VSNEQIPNPNIQRRKGDQSFTPMDCNKKMAREKCKLSENTLFAWPAKGVGSMWVFSTIEEVHKKL